MFQVMMWSDRSVNWQLYGASRNKAEMEKLYAELKEMHKDNPDVFGLRLVHVEQEWTR